MDEMPRYFSSKAFHLVLKSCQVAWLGSAARSAIRASTTSARESNCAAAMRMTRASSSSEICRSNKSRWVKRRSRRHSQRLYRSPARGSPSPRDPGARERGLRRVCKLEIGRRQQVDHLAAQEVFGRQLEQQDDRFGQRKQHQRFFKAAGNRDAVLGKAFPNDPAVGVQTAHHHADLMKCQLTNLDQPQDFFCRRCDFVLDAEGIDDCALPVFVGFRIASVLVVVKQAGAGG